MRREIFENVKWKLLSSGLAKHVDLWNHNVEFIEQEEAWERPAVFVEFGSIAWTCVKGGEYRGRGSLRLHIVTDWATGADSLPGISPATELPCTVDGRAIGGTGAFELCGAIDAALKRLRGETFHELRLVESLTNHNHEEILETVEVYEVRGVRRVAEEPAGEAAGTVASEESEE